jgi:hypothetical protein
VQFLFIFVFVVWIVLDFTMIRFNPFAWGHLEWNELASPFQMCVTALFKIYYHKDIPQLAKSFPYMPDPVLSVQFG